jgi:hypothetical protein
MPSVKFKEPSNLEKKEEPVVEPVVEPVKKRRTRKPKTEAKAEEKTTDEVKPEKKKRTRKPKTVTPPAEEKEHVPIERKTRKTTGGYMVKDGVITNDPQNTLEEEKKTTMTLRPKKPNKWQVHLKNIFAENKGKSFSEVMKIARECYVK